MWIMVDKNRRYLHWFSLTMRRNTMPDGFQLGLGSAPVVAHHCGHASWSSLSSRKKTLSNVDLPRDAVDFFWTSGVLVMVSMAYKYIACTCISVYIWSIYQIMYLFIYYELFQVNWKSVFFATQKDDRWPRHRFTIWPSSCRTQELPVCTVWTGWYVDYVEYESSELTSWTS